MVLREGFVGPVIAILQALEVKGKMCIILLRNEVEDTEEILVRAYSKGMDVQIGY